MFGGLDSPPPVRGRFSFGAHDVLIVSCRAPSPASEDGVQLGGVKRFSVLTACEPAQASGTVEEPRCR